MRCAREGGLKRGSDECQRLALAVGDRAQLLPWSVRPATTSRGTQSLSHQTGGRWGREPGLQESNPSPAPPVWPPPLAGCRGTAQSRRQSSQPGLARSTAPSVPGSLVLASDCGDRRWHGPARRGHQAGHALLPRNLSPWAIQMQGSGTAEAELPGLFTRAAALPAEHWPWQGHRGRAAQSSHCPARGARPPARLPNVGG